MMADYTEVFLPRIAFYPHIKLFCNFFQSILICSKSLAKFGNFRTDAVESTRERHVHELGLSVHLEATKDR